jgi:hypothetical protein
LGEAASFEFAADFGGEVLGFVDVALVVGWTACGF